MARNPGQKNHDPGGDLKAVSNKSLADFVTGSHSLALPRTSSHFSALARLPAKNPVIQCQRMSDQIQPIDGIEQLDAIPAGAQPFTKIYYRDMEEDLVATVKALPVREWHVIVPLNGWPKRIYRRADSGDRKPERKKR